MSSDVAIDLIKDVNTAFQKNCVKDRNISKLMEKLDAGEATYKDAYSFATSIGNARAKAFKSEITSNRLPDGKMYYNIGSRLLNNTLGEDYNLVAEYAQGVQEALNAQRGISLKGLKADKDNDRIKGFIDRLSSEEDYDKVAWILDEPVKVHALSVVDDTIQKNAEFQDKAGIGVKVIRIAEADCCKWCSLLDGEYTYPGVKGEIFQRHDNCRCIVEYDGHKLSAYESKNGAHSFRDTGEYAAKEESLRTKDGGEYGVNWNEVKSKEYTNKFSAISDNEKANELAAQRARNILVHREGKNTEEMYAISLTSGKDISKIIDQNYPFAVKRTEKFTNDINRASERGETVLFLHNHPRSYVPSVADLNELVGTNSKGLIVGHDGSLILYTAPSKKIEDSDYAVAFMDLMWYSGDAKLDQERTMEQLAKTFNFTMKRL